MTEMALSATQESEIEALVAHYRKNYPVFETFHKQLRSVVEDAALQPFVHSIKSRLKDPEHLRGKLRRKMRRSLDGGAAFDLTIDNLFSRINDLVGVRVLHLHTRQIEGIHLTLGALLEEHRFTVLEASARTWDLESKEFFTKLGIATQDSSSLYTSVHYIIDPSAKTQRTAEIQVRTLAEEIWGEVDHTINYPDPSGLLACREQLKALARVTSSCSRLVDSIFATHEEGSVNAMHVQRGDASPADADDRFGGRTGGA